MNDRDYQDYARATNKKYMALCLLAVMLLYTVIFCDIACACSRDVATLSPETQQKLSQLKEAASAEGISFKTICTHRSQTEQDLLYARGRTEPGPKVTWTKRSRHTDGEAFDVVILKEDGSADWRGESYIRIGTLGKGLGLVWGGDWKVRDYGHFELENRSAGR